MLLPITAGLTLLVAPVPVLATGAPTATALEGELEAAKWLHHVGQVPTLESLRGQTVLVHYFRATEKDVKKNNWAWIRKFHHEYAAKGLVCLALCPEPEHEVREYLLQNDIPFPVGVGSTPREELGGDRQFWHVLYGTDGEVYWHGPTNGLWNGKLLKALKGSKRAGPTGALRLTLPEMHGRRMKSAVKKAGDGKLAAAWTAAVKVLGDERASDDDRSDAQLVKESVEGHVDLVLEQIQELIADLDVLLALQALEVLEKELAKTPLAERVEVVAEQVRATPFLDEEIEAAERYDKLLETYYRLGYEKSRSRFQALIDDFPKTRAARRAENLLAKR